MKVIIRLHRYWNASITAEASFAVPIFFLAILALIYFFEGMGLQSRMQAKLAEAGRNYAVMGIESPLFRTEQGAIYPLIWKTEGTGGYCALDIHQMIPGVPMQLLQLNLYQSIQISSYQGRSMVPGQTDGNTEYVYLAENASVYHRKVDCTYLKLGIRSVAGGQVDSLRNQSGGKYKACESCVEGGAAASYPIVYITPYGARFHRIRDCSGLRRSVRRVPLSSIGALPPCSKCGSVP